MPNILELERRAEMVPVIFNNNYENQGQRNAATFMNLLGTAGPVHIGQQLLLQVIAVDILQELSIRPRTS